MDSLDLFRGDTAPRSAPCATEAPTRAEVRVLLDHRQSFEGGGYRVAPPAKSFERQREKMVED